MSKLKTLPLDENGQPLSSDAISAFLDEADEIAVPITRRDGRTATFAAVVDHTRVKTPHLKKYQLDVAAIADYAEQKAAEEAAQEAETEGEDTTDGESEITANDVKAQAEVVDILGRYARAEADLLGRLVLETNIPGVEVDSENGVSPDFLVERVGTGPAFRKALREYFFPSSKKSEEETGTSEAANITDTSSTLEQTDDAENIPPTS